MKKILGKIENFLIPFALLAGGVYRAKGLNSPKKSDYVARIILSLFGIIIFSLLFIIIFMAIRSLIMTLL